MKMEPLTAGDLGITPAESGSGTGAGTGPATLTLTWKGKGTERAPATVITPWLLNCLSRAKDISAVLHVNVVAVDHMNSATITTLVQLIREARAREVKLVLTYDEKKSWQELSFGALSVFVKDDGLFVIEKAAS